jgi:hypothetical protein
VGPTLTVRSKVVAQAIEIEDDCGPWSSGLSPTKHAVAPAAVTNNPVIVRLCRAYSVDITLLGASASQASIAAARIFG